MGHFYCPSTVEAREAIQTHLAALFPDENHEQEQQTAVVGTTDSALPLQGGPSVAVAGPSPTPLPVALAEPEREDLATENAQRHDWIDQCGKPQRDVRGLYHYYQRRADFRISTTDPDATIMGLKGGGVHLGYHVHYVVDGGKRRIILAVLVTPSEVMDNQPMLDLLWHVRFRWHLWPRHVTGDTKYGTIENIKAIEDQDIRAYVPLPDWEHMTPYYGPSKFVYDAAHDRYICPNDQPLRLTRIESKAEKREYTADAATCNACPLKAHCTPSNHGRQVHRSFHAAYLERVKGYHQTEAYHKAMRKRKVWVEPLFAEAKEWHGMRRFRLRRLWRVNCEAQVIAAGQNLKRLLQKRGWGRRPFPTEAMATVPPANQEPDESPRDHLLKSQKPSIAVASLVACWAIRTFFGPQMSWFSLLNTVLLLFHLFLFYAFNKILLFYRSFYHVSPSLRNSLHV